MFVTYEMAKFNSKKTQKIFAFTKKNSLVGSTLGQSIHPSLSRRAEKRLASGRCRSFLNAHKCENVSEHQYVWDFFCITCFVVVAVVDVPWSGQHLARQWRRSKTMFVKFSSIHKVTFKNTNKDYKQRISGLIDILTRTFWRHENEDIKAEFVFIHFKRERGR